MTDCNLDPLRFSTLGPKTVVADFQGGRLTTDAGALLLREIERPPRPLRRPRRRDPRPTPSRLHRPRPEVPCSPSGSSPSLWATRTSTTIRPSAPTPRCRWPSDGAPTPTCPSPRPPTLCRFENRVDRKTLVQCAEVLVDQFLAAHPEPPEHLMLAFDATDDPVHGHQEQRFFHGYYDRHFYFTIICILLRRAACGRPSAQQQRRQQTRPCRVETVGPAAPRRLAGREDHVPGRQRVLPLAADALVRLAWRSAASSAWPRTRSWSRWRATRSSGPSGSSAAPASRSASSGRSPTRRGAGTGGGG